MRRLWLSMMSLRFTTDEVVYDGLKLQGALAELENAVIALFWEGDRPRLGTLTLTLPGGVTSTLLGERSHVIGQLVGERLATSYGKMIMVSTRLEISSDSRAARVLLELAKRLTRGGARDE